MSNFITTIVNAGNQYDLPEYLKNRVRPTNILCLLFIVVLSIPFTIISLYFFPKMAFFPSVGGLVCIAIILVNGLGGIYYSRVLLPVLLLILSSFYNAFFSTSMGDSITSVYLVELSFTLVPFIVFDFREKGFLIFCTLFSMLIILVFPSAWSHFDMGYDGSVLREGPLAVLTTCLALITQLGSITGLAYLNRQAETKSAHLLAQMNEKNAEVEQSKKELVSNLEQLEKARAEETNRQWAAEGIAKISEVLHSHDHENLIYDKVMAYIIKYIGANQGGLYLVENNDSQVNIRLTACYAYERKKFIEQTILPGQGLLGQTFLEKEYIYLTQIPQNYISITSGLGEARPSCLLIMPLMINNTVEGLLEIASFKELAQHQISFIQKLSETVASFIQNNRINEQTKKLLAVSQQQAEEMRAQEEEMRQNMEELEATQEEARRVSSEIQAQTSIINNIALVTKTDLQGNITYVNDEFLKWSKYTENEVKGRNHRFLKSGEHSDELFKDIWETISSGKIFRGEIRNKAKDGSFYWVDAIIAPVLGEDGKPKEYIAQCFVINEAKKKEARLAQALQQAQQLEKQIRQHMEQNQDAELKK